MKQIFIVLFILVLFSNFSYASEIHSKDEYKRAIKQYSKLIKKYPNNWIFYYNRGMLFYEQGKDYTEYVYRNFEKASALKPESEELKYNYLIIKEFRDVRLRQTLVGVNIGGVIGGGVMSGTLPRTMPVLKPLDTKVWETLNNPEFTD